MIDTFNHNLRKVTLVKNNFQIKTRASDILSLEDSIGTIFLSDNSFAILQYQIYEMNFN